ncbi:MAG TPA: tetratricopeptide repeat protein [Sphingobacteriaceae bacterium]
MKKLILLIFLLAGNVVTAQVNSTDEALAFQYFQNGEYEKAVVLYKKLYDQKNRTAVYDQYYEALLKLKSYDEAEQLARRQMKTAPGSYMYAVDLGRVYLERGDHKKAEEWFNKLIADLPKDELAIRDLATNFYRAEAYEMAVKTFNTGRKLLSNEQAFAFDLIGLYRFRKEKGLLITEYVNISVDNPSVIPQAQSVLAHILEDNDDYYVLKSALLRKLQKNPGNTGLSELLTWTYIQADDYPMALRQTIALDKRLREDGSRVFDLARLMFNDQELETTVEALEYIIAKGQENELYVPARIEMINVKSRLLAKGKLSRNQLYQLEKEYQELLQEFGKNARTAFAVRQLARLEAFELKKFREAEQLLEDLLQVPGLSPEVAAQVKLELGDIYILTGEVWEANLIYAQVEKQAGNAALGQEAKFRNARLSYYQGDFEYARAQLDVLKSATSQLIANDALNLSLLISENMQNSNDSAALRMYARSDKLLSISQDDAALKTLDSIDAMYPGHSLTDDILMSKARIYMNRGGFEEAAGFLQKLIDNYSYELWADDALFMLADMLENRLKQTEKAKVLYERIITDYPGSLFVAEARKRFRNLRGDKLG